MSNLQGKTIRLKSPTRVDLAGGTLDCWPLHLFVGDCQTINLAIDIYTGCELTELPTPHIEVHISDLNFSKRYINLSEFLNSTEGELLLLQKVIEYFKPTYGFRIQTSSQSPVGGGLGGSSSLCISLIKAFLQKNQAEMAVDDMVELAHNLEAKIIKSPTGTQDYYPAIVGGLNVIHYTARGPELEQLDVPLNALRENILLVYTGKAHHSGINNWQVIKSVIEGDKSTLLALKKIAEISKDTVDACRKEKWHSLPDLFRSEFDARIQLTPMFTSPEIEKLKKISMESGAQAVKICGAGGGGCVLVWAPQTHHERISEVCRKNGFQPKAIQPIAAL